MFHFMFADAVMLPYRCDVLARVACVCVCVCAWLATATSPVLAGVLLEHVRV